MKDKNSSSIRNKKEDNPFDRYKTKRPNADKFLDYKINMKTLASISTSYSRKFILLTFSNKKPFFSYKETLNKAYNKLYKVLYSYNISKEKLNIKIINEIIFDKNKKIVSIFKDNLLWHETSDFLKCYYKKNQSIKMIQNFSEFYETYTQFYPEYGPLEEVLKILKKTLKERKNIWKE